MAVCVGLMVMCGFCFGVMDTYGSVCWGDGYVWFLCWGDGYV